jgi:predicted NAD/FAD-binding protein
MKKIAIIGSGISGLSAAYFLKNHHQVTLFEKEPRLGGHSRTITLNDGTKVDTGFIVFNDRTYPELNALFRELSVEIEKTEMSFAVCADDGKLEWSGKSLDTLFAQRKNIFSLSMIKGLLDVLKFNGDALRIIADFPDLTLEELLRKMNMGDWFKHYYIFPMGGAIWSSSFQDMLEFPAFSFVKFFDHHGLLSLKNRPQWYTLKDRSISYVEKLEDLISKKGRIIKDVDVCVQRREDKVWVLDEEFDEIIFACHGKDVLNVLQDTTEKERDILSKFQQKKNIVYTHTDVGQMPKIKKCWSSWNYLYRKDRIQDTACTTYWMNKLQHISPENPVFVTLNPIKPIDDSKIQDIHEFYHPLFSQTSIDGQRELEAIQGMNHTWFCGAYLRYGFHEDGIWSSRHITKKMAEKWS